MAEIVDLDTLVPEARVVKLGGEEIEIQPPSTEDVLKLGVLGQKFEKMGDMSAEQTADLMAELSAQVRKCLPAIGDTPLNTKQLIKLMEIITEMAMPDDMIELKARGITPNNPKV